MTGSERVALVTGAARRIGAAIARRLHEDGYFVVVHYRHSAGEAEALVARLNADRPDSAIAIKADLDAVENCRALVASVGKRFGRLDLLVNNASTFFPTPLTELDEPQWETLMASNLKAPLFLAHAAFDLLANAEGSIVNITDVHAERPMAGYPVYSVAKAGLVMLTKSLALEMGPAVRVNAVAPGSILWPEGEHGDAVAKPELLEKTALKRQGEPADIAGAVSYLAGARYVTGQVVAVDGGRSLNL